MGLMEVDKGFVRGRGLVGEEPQAEGSAERRLENQA